MREWQVVYTELAEQDLRSIFEYIAYSLLEPEIARNQSRRIMDAISRLNTMPLRFHLYEEEPWHSKGLRVLPVDHFVVFYLPVASKSTVAVIRIMYGGRNMNELLLQTEAEE